MSLAALSYQAAYIASQNRLLNSLGV